MFIRVLILLLGFSIINTVTAQSFIKPTSSLFGIVGPVKLMTVFLRNSETEEPKFLRGYVFDELGQLTESVIEDELFYTDSIRNERLGNWSIDLPSVMNLTWTKSLLTETKLVNLFGITVNTNYKYDNSGRLVFKTRSVSGTATKGVTQLTYTGTRITEKFVQEDEFSNRVVVEDFLNSGVRLAKSDTTFRKGEVQEESALSYARTFDGNGRVSGTFTTDALSGKIIESSSFSYDSDGRLESIERSDKVTIEFEYSTPKLIMEKHFKNGELIYGIYKRLNDEGNTELLVEEVPPSNFSVFWFEYEFY